jgi:hypothetical protein
MAQKKTLGAYRADTATGWAAYANDGTTWPISADEAAELPHLKPYSELADQYRLNP